MNRNVESHFSELPSVEIGRSIFDRSFSHKTSFDSSLLIPFFWDECLPGDTFNVTTSLVARLQTLLTPIMDNVYLDTYYFFVPARLTWSHWKNFMGESEQAWYPATQYTVPYLKYPSGGFDSGTIADYMGVPIGVEGAYPVSGAVNSQDCPMALPFRAYALICNEWFRDQNVSDPLQIDLDDTIRTGSNGSNYITDIALGGMPFKVAKYHDYFTSALPTPLKAQPVAVAPLQISDLFPVITYNEKTNENGPPMLMQTVGGTIHKIFSNSTDYTAASENATANAQLYERPINLFASVQTDATMTINELRLAFQTQKFYEKMARAGSRYRETLREHFGVTSPDARMMIPEYLGGHRVPLQIHQVTNQSEGESDFLGDLGAMSNTADVHEDFIKSFSEHGFVLGLCCVRYDHSYPQGLEKAWSRRDKLDYYWPVFANIGEQPIKKREIMLVDAPNATNDAVFGYQEAWAEYRYKPNRVSGEMRPGIQNSLASWHLADYYTQVPSLSDSWIREDKTNLDRVLAVTSSVSNQVFCDFYVKNIVTRCMPMYSIPGLVDHH